MSEVPVGVRRDIDRHVDRLLADLRGLPPPLSLDTVQSLLKLDLSYYTAANPSAVSGFVHRMRIARHQLIERPTLAWDVIRKLDLKALWLPDQRRILVDSDLPPPKIRWATGHEFVHSLLPWHETFTHGDRLGTLRHDCHQDIEAEANYGTSRLLFMGSEFDSRVGDCAFTFDDIQPLSRTFGNSLASTTWRFVTSSPHTLIGMVSDSPFSSSSDAGRIRHIFCSPNYTLLFGPPEVARWQSILAKTVRPRSGGPCGEMEHPIYTLDGISHKFLVRCFNTTHAILTIACDQGQLPTIG